MTSCSQLSENAHLALETIHGNQTRGIPIWQINPMEHRIIDRIAGVPEGTYVNKPLETYMAMLRASSVCMIDQFIPYNPLSMKSEGYDENSERTATTGATELILDGITIDSPDAVAEHMESILIPKYIKEAKTFDAEAWRTWIMEHETSEQKQIGADFLKAPYGWVQFPGYLYHIYGYENYFMAYALYPEITEAYFSASADLWALKNAASVPLYQSGALPPMHRLDHDMADSRSTLTSLESLDRMWFPHFSRAIKPLVDAGVTLIWHCDGNLMDMVPRLLECGLGGFQGFQYEDGMDYERICNMKTREGKELLIIAGVSVTRTLPMGTPKNVADEMKWLVKHGPKQGLFLGGSSSIAPGVSWENIKALIDGFAYYRKHGRKEI